MLKFGLCCIFKEENIKFSTTTVTAFSKLDRKNGLIKISNLALSNLDALLKALTYCNNNNIRAFRIGSGFFPLITHPVVGYKITEVPNLDLILEKFAKCKEYASNHNIRTSFHPDQFVVVNSPKPEVVNASIQEIEYQAELSELIGSDVVNIHGGGVYGDKQSALLALERNLDKLSERARKYVTLENDDKSYTPQDLLPICHKMNIPLVYDVHHHRCNKDSLNEVEATDACMTTWNREPLFHVSSPILGWNNPKIKSHHDYIDVQDFPKYWLDKDITVDIEAKAKELAVRKLMKELNITA